MRTVIILLLTVVASRLYATGDALAGESKAVICAACHGQHGVSTSPIWPNLAGQHARYLVQQLQHFKLGKDRIAAAMSPMAAGLSPEDMADLAAYFAAQARAPAFEKKSTRGEALYRTGDSQRGIPACSSCHGPDGHGNAQAGFPLLAHQPVVYTVQQLLAFHTGARKTDPLAIMRTIAGKLNATDMQDVAEYLAGI